MQLPDESRNEPRRALGIADRDAERRVALARGLAERGFDVRTWPSAVHALETLDVLPARAVLLCEAASGVIASRVRRHVSELRPDLGLAFLTELARAEEIAASAPETPLVSWPSTLDGVAAAVERVGRHHAEQRRTQVRAAALSEEVWGESEVMCRLRESLARAASSECAVLLTGETGTGKDLVANAIHRASGRRGRPFVALNCAAMPAALVESELFGHVLGAFTGARVGKRGLFLAASHGTLLLDEVGELPLATQPKLLRALQNRVVRAVGGAEEAPFDVRLVCTSNTDLAAAITQNRFRSDLYFRVSAIHIALPPLRHRGDDVVSLARAMVRREARKVGKDVEGLTDGCAERLLAHAWPGNVRELQNAVERAVAFTTSPQLTEADLPETISAAAPQAGHDERDALVSLAEVERRHIVRVLSACAGREAQAARILGVSSAVLRRKLAQHGVMTGRSR